MKDIAKLYSSSERVKSRSTTAKWHLYNCITPRLQLIINNKDAMYAEPLFMKYIFVPADKCYQLYAICYKYMLDELKIGEHI